MAELEGPIATRHTKCSLGFSPEQNQGLYQHWPQAGEGVLQNGLRMLASHELRVQTTTDEPACHIALTSAHRGLQHECITKKLLQ